MPVTLKSLVFERASVLFNLASLYSQLAASVDRSNGEGIKRAVNYYQVGYLTTLSAKLSNFIKHAAGTLSHLNTSVLPNMAYPPDEERPIDLSSTFIEGLQSLMLAQAQECSWQLAKISEHDLLSGITI